LPHSRIVVIGASAGGFEAVRAVLEALPDDFPAAVLVVIHTGPNGVFPDALARNTPLPVVAARDGERLEGGRVYVAPPDQHLTVTDGVVRVARGPREHGFRPAIDPLFTTAAQAAGERVAGVILSGALSDGTIGLHAIKHAGGLAVVQHPEEAPVPSMPLSALRSVEVDAILPVSAIGPQLVEWAMNGARPGPEEEQREGRTTRGKGSRPEPEPQLMAVTCPSCGGAISEVEEKGLARYECHVGHRFDVESLVALGDERTENTLWTAMRALQEQALLRQRMVQRAHGRGLGRLASTWRQEAADAEARADEIRRLIEGAPVAKAEQLVKLADARAAGGNGGPGRPRGRRRAKDTAVTREQARLSKRLHQASRARTRGASNGRPRKGLPASNGKPRTTRRRR
jgi:two-component system chemotaxis response regulator CheB